MKHEIKLIVLLSVLFMLTACATVPERQPLAKINRSEIKSGRIFLNTTQRQIVMQHNNSFDYNLPDPYSPMDSGYIVHRNFGYQPPNILDVLIVAAVQHHEANKSLQTMLPIDTVLENFNYLDYFNSQLKQKIAQIPWLKIREQNIRYDVLSSEAEVLASAKENTTLFIGTTYALNSKLNKLEVIAYVKLAEKSDKNQIPKTLYANNFYYIYKLNSNDNTQANKNIWIKDNGQLLKAKLLDAGSLISRMIAMDIKNPSVDPYAHINKVITLQTVDGVSVKAKLISQQNGYDIASLITGGSSSGYMYAINNNDLIN